ncbi:transposase family protein [Streptosporangium algeriense]|uniref:Transposase family protein n=1 Tax=Streptosporangium algeriense TaxID=1682748 RepID=A0ABW3DNA6_9ACTN
MAWVSPQRGGHFRAVGCPLIDRVAADRPCYFGRHRHHGVNIQVISAPDGTPLWISGSPPGAVHDLKAARIWDVIRRLAASGPVTLADNGYAGAGEKVLVPYKGRNKPSSQKNAGSAHARPRAPAERANAQLKGRHVVRKLRCCPLCAGRRVKEILAPQVREAR